MPDKEILQAVLDAVGVNRGRQAQRESRCPEEEACSVPENVIYVIICNCVTINNGACEDWQFCNSGCRQD